MNKSIIVLLLICSLFVFIKCSFDEGDKRSVETDIFKKYLKKVSYSIPKHNHLFIIKSDLSCKGCMSTGKKIINGYFGNMNSDNTTIIDSKKIDWIFNNSFNVIIDSNLNFQKINIEIYNFTFIHTNNNKIKSISQLTALNSTKIDSLLTNFYLAQE